MHPQVPVPEESQRTATNRYQPVHEDDLYRRHHRLRPLRRLSRRRELRLPRPDNHARIQLLPESRRYGQGGKSIR